MKILFLRWSVRAFVVGTLTILSAGCILSDGGYGYDGGGYGASYYEQPYGADYGGWGPGYHVAPFRGGDHLRTDGGGRASGHAYRSAPASRSMPSLPAHSRSVGGGGGHVGGDDGRR